MTNQLGPWLAPLWRRLTDLIYPGCCVLCGSPLEGAALPLCRLHEQAVLSLSCQQHCPACGQRRGPYGPSEVRCPRCPRRKLYFSRITCVSSYAEPVRGVIHAFKYDRHLYLDRILAQWMWAAAERSTLADQIDLFVPVPQHWRRYWQRGFNQSLLLASALGRCSGRPVWNLARKAQHRLPQTVLPRRRRYSNIRGVFQVEQTEKLLGKRVCIVDDVLTTGATVSELARALRRRGAGDVVALVAAVADPPRGR